MNTTQIKRVFAAATSPLAAIKLAHITQDAGHLDVAAALALQCRVLKAREKGNVAEAARLSAQVGAKLRAMGC